MEQAGTASPAEVLCAARRLIEDPRDWASNVLELIDGRHCMATATSSSGPAYRYLLRATGTWALGPYNDSHTHAEVLATFDRAIDLAEAEA